METGKENKTGEAVVGFIDVLGYGEVVEEHINNIELIEGIKRIMTGACLIPKRAKEKRIKIENENDKTDYDNIMSAISVRYVSDTFLFVLRLSDIADSNIDVSDALWAYFTLISQICSFFMGKVELVLKGGISIGSHYEDEEGGNLFIFSKAYLDAYKLQAKENKPRIVLDKHLTERLRSLPFKHFDYFFFKDDNSLCFDIYCAPLNAISRGNNRFKTILSDIKQGVQANINKNRNKPNVLEKLEWFATYHNKRVNPIGCKDLSITPDILRKGI